MRAEHDEIGLHFAGAGNYHVSHGLCHGTNDDRLELDPGVARCAVDRCQ